MILKNLNTEEYKTTSFTHVQISQNSSGMHFALNPSGGMCVNVPATLVLYMS